MESESESLQLLQQSAQQYAEDAANGVYDPATAPLFETANIIMDLYEYDNFDSFCKALRVYKGSANLWFSGFSGKSSSESYGSPILSAIALDFVQRPARADMSLRYIRELLAHGADCNCPAGDAALALGKNTRELLLDLYGLDLTQLPLIFGLMLSCSDNPKKYDILDVLVSPLTFDPDKTEGGADYPVLHYALELRLFDEANFLITCGANPRLCGPKDAADSKGMRKIITYQLACLLTK